MATLEEFPDDYSVPDDEAARDAWRIDSYAKAAWAMEQYAWWQERRAEVAAVAAARIDRIRRWAQQEDARLAGHARFFEGHLEGYGLRQRAEDKDRRKTFTLPDGVVETRETAGAWEVTDPPAVLAWARANRPGLVRQPSAPPAAFAKSEAMRVLVQPAGNDGGEVTDPASGELVPGIKVGPRVITAHVKVGGRP